MDERSLAHTHWLLLIAKKGLMLFRVRHPHIASLAAVRTIVHSVHGQADVVLRLAEAAEFLAGTLRFRLVALRTESNHGRRISPGTPSVSLNS
jgi:hypothetical protein